MDAKNNATGGKQQINERPSERATPSRREKRVDDRKSFVIGGGKRRRNLGRTAHIANYCRYALRSAPVYDGKKKIQQQTKTNTQTAEMEVKGKEEQCERGGEIERAWRERKIERIRNSLLLSVKLLMTTQ